MNEIYIDLRKLNGKEDCYIKDYFKSNDLISVQRLIDEFNEIQSRIEDYECLLEEVVEKIKDTENNGTNWVYNAEIKRDIYNILEDIKYDRKGV